MQTTWIVAADASRARVFEIAGPERELREVDQFTHPEGRASNQELKSDANGSRRTGQGGDSNGQRVTPVEHENELFSKAVARYLDKARSQHRYDKLYLIAPPEFLGLMRENLGKEVRKIIAEEINKDLSWFGTRDIERYVKPLGRAAWTREKANGNGNGKGRKGNGSNGNGNGQARKARPPRSTMPPPARKSSKRAGRRGARAS
jgi:protein required for attachment to host cells